MSEILDLNKIKNILSLLAKKNGVTEEQLLDSWNEETDQFNWKVSYASDLQQDFEGDFRLLALAIKRCELALAKSDVLPMRSCLMRARVAAMNLSSFFDSIGDDIERILILERDAVDSEQFPEDYVLPDEYKNLT